jgi:hypothetical protein
MRRLQPILRVAFAGALLASLPVRAAPPQVMTYSGYLMTAAGAPVTAATNITFRLYTASSGGTAVWSETVSVTPSADGWFSAVIGTATALPFSILNQDLYLALEVGSDAEIADRARVTPSPSALTVDWSGVQGKPSCAAGDFLTLDGGGGLTCTTPLASGVGSVSATSPVVSSGGASPVVSLTDLCPDGSVLKSNGGSWACATDLSSGGTVTAVVAGTGLVTAPPAGITTSGNVAIDTTAVPLLGAGNNVFSGTVTAPSFVGDLSGNASNATHLGGQPASFYQAASTALTSSSFTAPGGRYGAAATVARGDHTHRIHTRVPLADFNVQSGAASFGTASVGTLPATKAWALPPQSCIKAFLVIPPEVVAGPSVVVDFTSSAAGTVTLSGSYIAIPGGYSPPNSHANMTSATATVAVGALYKALLGAGLQTIATTAVGDGDGYDFRICNFMAAGSATLQVVAVQFVWN